MPTAHEHRLIIICPVGAKLTGVVSWFHTNIGAASVPSNLGPSLFPTAGGATTHSWCCGAFTDAECKAILLRICQLASVTPPTNPQWNGWTGNQKLAWLAGVRADLLAGFGIYVTLARNEGVWDNPDAALAAMGLRTTQV
jgi:hypothetical protein